MSHEILDAQIRSCTRCSELAATRTTVVVGDIPAGARLVIVGEAPGAEEDRTGRPFVGRSGKLLDALLLEAGAERRHVAVLNTIKCRPPGNRVPTSQETANCRPWTNAQLAQQQPRIVVALGLSATRWLLKAATLTAVRGRVHEVDGRSVLPTYHPAAALRGGPSGEPMTLLRQDLRLAAELAG